MEDDPGFSAEELVQACNKILVYAGLIARVANVEEVRAVCSSTGVLVAALEGFLQQRLDDVIRAPSSPDERAFNNNLVVDVLSQILGTDLSHISGERIVEGSLEDISNLLELLAALCNGMPLQGPPPAQDGADADEADNAADAEAEEDAPPAAAAEAGGQSDGEGVPAGDDEEGEAETGEGEEDEGETSDDSADAPSSWHVRYPDEEEQEGAEAYSDQYAEAGAQEDFGGQDTSQRRQSRAVRQLALSPIQEASREGGEGMQASLEQPGAPSTKSGADRGRASRGGAIARRSAGGASSVISIPSDVGDDASRRSTGGDSSGRSSSRHEPPQGPPRPAGSAADSERTGTDGSLSPASASTTALLERALSEAEATLRELGHEYEDFYHGEEKAPRESLVSRQGGARRKGSARGKSVASSDGAGSRASKASGDSKHKAARRALRAGPWPDGETGTVEQHKAFLRRAKRALGGGASADSGSEAPSRSSRGKSKSTGGSSTTSGLGLKSSGRRGLVPLPGAQSRPPGKSRRGGEDAYTVLLRALRGVQGPHVDATKEGRHILQRSGGTLGTAVSLGSSAWDSSSAGEGVARLPAGYKYTGPGKGLSAGLESRLRHVSRLASGDPKQLAAREAVQNLAITEELLRTVRRKELVDRLASARARREAALRLTADRLHEQGREYEKRVEQLRLQRLAAEWNAQQRSAQMRRALQAELVLRDTFLEVLRGEKEVLLAEQRDARASGAFPMYHKAMRMAERENQELLRRLEGLLVAERQQRLLADRETFLAQRHENQLAAAVVRDRMQELLGRIAREEEAILQRRSIATQPQSRQQLMIQMRKMLGLS